jgi:signal transduction histidine kinase
VAEHAVLTAGGRVLLIARTALAVALGVAGPSHLLPLAIIVAIASAGQAAAINKCLFAVLLTDLVLLLAVLTLAGPGPLYLGFAASFAAFSGLRLGFLATPIWVAELLQMYAVDRTAHAATVASAIVIPAGTTAALLASLLTQQARRRTAELAAAQREAAALERARLARELHDSVAKTVRGMSLAALALPRSVGQQPLLAQQLADAISTAAVTAERETRDLLAGLRLDSPDEDFPAALTRLCDLWSSGTGVPVDCRIPPIEPPVPVRYELVRILQEALTNTGRHARAGRVEVALGHDEHWLWLTVRDDGAGFAVPEDLSVWSERGHHGLVGMAERARSVGGRLDVVARPGRGTTITVRLPT